MDRITDRQYAALVKAEQFNPRAFKASIPSGDIPTTKHEASRAISMVMDYCGGYRSGSRSAMIAESLRANGNSAVATYTELVRFLGHKPLEFSANSGGSRTPYPMPRQKELLQAEIQEMLKDFPAWNPPPNSEADAGGAMPNADPGYPDGSESGEQPSGSEDGDAEGHSSDAEGNSGDSEGSEQGQDGEAGSDAQSDGEQEGEDADSEADSEPEDKPEPQSKTEKEAEDFLNWLQNVARPFVDGQDADGLADPIGMRPAQNGSKMIRCGIPADACKHALTLHWSNEARRHVGVKEFHPENFRKDLRRSEFHHNVVPYCLHVLQAKVPLALIGPAGTGKTTIAEQIAQVLSEILGRDMPFGTMSMTAGTSPVAFNGRVNPFDNSKTPSQFVNILRNGGVFLFDEMDAADGNMLLKANQPIANGKFVNDATGETIVAHEHAYLIAGMNTMGTGADRSYSDRNKQDAAALDRWSMGRVKVNLDQSLETVIYNHNLSNFEPNFDFNGNGAA